MTRIDHLLNQFAKAKGIKHLDLNSEKCMEDFVNFVAEMKMKSKNYAAFLYSLGLDFTEQDTAEVGKGKDDTAVEAYDTTIITTDPEYRFLDINQSRIINGEMIVCDKEPFLYNGRDISRLPFYIRNYMTQNPYTRKDLTGFEDLHNSGNANIIVGVYGNIHDKDLNEKIKTIKALKYKLDNDIIEDYSTEDESYFYALGSGKRHVKVRVRERLYERLFNYENAYAFEEKSKTRSR